MIEDAHRDEQDEMIRSVIKELMREGDMFSSSYHGPNCRHCNRFPSMLRRSWWRIEDLIDWFYGLFQKDEIEEETEPIIVHSYCVLF